MDTISLIIHDREEKTPKNTLVPEPNSIPAAAPKASANTIFPRALRNGPFVSVSQLFAVNDSLYEVTSSCRNWNEELHSASFTFEHDENRNNPNREERRGEEKRILFSSFCYLKKLSIDYSYAR